MSDSNPSFNGASFFRKRRRVTDHHTPADTSPSFPPLNLSQSADGTYTANNDIRPTTAYRTGESPVEPPVKLRHRRDSSLSSLTDLKSSLRRRSTSLRSKRGLSPTNWDNLATSISPVKRSASNFRPQLSTTTLSSQASRDSFSDINPPYSGPPTEGVRLGSSHGYKKEESTVRPATSLGSGHGASANRTVSSSIGGSGGQDPRSLVKKIHEIAAKRISLLNYLRMIYASETHWFNTYRFSPPQIAALPSMTPLRLAKRTQSLLLLGLSLPFVLDPNGDSLPDYLRTFYALLVEYETYVSLHPTDGSTSSALSRARIPQMFKRSGPPKNRRRGSADALITSPQDDPRSAGSGSLNSAGLPSATWTSFYNSGPDGELAPGEEYQFLITPSLPFELDYFETFATLCDVLRDCYRRVTLLVGPQDGPLENTTNLQGLMDLFTKVDTKVKKIVMVGLVREFEDASRQGIRSELAGVGKLVLGGLV